jgi:hypothetical protein
LDDEIKDKNKDIGELKFEEEDDEE